MDDPLPHYICPICFNPSNFEDDKCPNCGWVAPEDAPSRKNNHNDKFDKAMEGLK